MRFVSRLFENHVTRRLGTLGGSIWINSEKVELHSCPARWHFRDEAKQRVAVICAVRVELEALGVARAVHGVKWILAGLCVAVLGVSLYLWFTRREMAEWLEASWSLSKQILPLLLAGVLVAGALLGRPGHEALIPSDWVEWAVGGNSLRATFLASVLGALMYFATLTEVPILQGLIGSGMGEGPSLALLLAGPAVSLPNLLVIRQILGTWKTVVFLVLVVVMATLTGMLYGAIAG